MACQRHFILCGGADASLWAWKRSEARGAGKDFLAISPIFAAISNVIFFAKFCFLSGIFRLHNNVFFYSAFGDCSNSAFSAFGRFPCQDSMQFSIVGRSFIYCQVFVIFSGKISHYFARGFWFHILKEVKKSLCWLLILQVFTFHNIKTGNRIGDIWAGILISIKKKSNYCVHRHSSVCG